MEYAWIPFLFLVAVLYGPLFKRIYRKWKRARDQKQAPSTLLGVAYPQTQKDTKDK